MPRFRGVGTKPYIRYQARLKFRARSQRADPSPAARRLWFEFLRDLTPRFTREKPLSGYIADFYCSHHQLVVELDGDSHFNARAESYDAARTAALESIGIRVLRFTNAEVTQNFEEVCGAILRAISEPAR